MLSSQVRSLVLQGTVRAGAGVKLETLELAQLGARRVPPVEARVEERLVDVELVGLERRERRELRVEARVAASHERRVAESAASRSKRATTYSDD